MFDEPVATTQAVSTPATELKSVYRLTHILSPALFFSHASSQAEAIQQLKLILNTPSPSPSGNLALSRLRWLKENGIVNKGDTNHFRDLEWRIDVLARKVPYEVYIPFLRQFIELASSTRKILNHLSAKNKEI